MHLTRLLLATSLLISSLSASANEPAYVCKSEQGCVEVTGPDYDIGRGATISLSPGWKFFKYPQAPIPEMAGLREIRATKDGMVIAISPLPLPPQRTISEASLCEIVTKSGAHYVYQSKEKAVTTIPMINNDFLGCSISLTAKNDGEKPFAVLNNRHHASVSVFVIYYKNRDLVFNVSVVSEYRPDSAYLAAIDAIRQVHL